jgi:alkylated DNA repair dioxygenase AlkB
MNDSTLAENLLPYDGIALYIPNFIEQNEASILYDILLDSIEWQRDSVKMFGKTHILNRKMAWYGDSDKKYSYSGISRSPISWTSELGKIKQRCESICLHSFNSCLLNYYQDGIQGMGWHADNEKELGNNPIIASVSLGVVRTFRCKHRMSNHTIDIVLEPGSLLIMRGSMQHNWVHSLPISKKIKDARINCTFRTIIE